MGNSLEFFFFIIFPGIGFDYPDPVKIFPDHIIQLVVGFKDPLEDGMDPGHDQGQADGQHRHDSQEYEGELGINTEGKD